MSVTLSGPMVAPSSGAAKRAMVLLHGYGSNGQDLIALAPYFAEVLPDALFVAPNAPTPCPGLADGYQWFPVSFDTQLRGYEGIAGVRPVISRFLKDMWSQTGLDAAHTILAGFSQGAMIALDAGLHIDTPLCGIVSFSGGIPLAMDPDLSGAKGARVCLLHGEADEVVPVGMTRHAREIMDRDGVAASLHVTPGLGHSISPDGIDFARAFVAATGEARHD